MILEIRDFQIVRIMYDGKEIQPKELLNPEFRQFRYWDKYNNVKTFLFQKVIIRYEDDYGFKREKVTYPYRFYFQELTDDDSFDPFYDEGCLDLDLDIHYEELIQRIKGVRILAESREQ